MLKSIQCYLSKEREGIDERELSKLVRGRLKLAVESDADSVHTSIQLAFQMYFQKRWGLNRSQFDKDVIEELLLKNKFEPSLVYDVVSILETCEMARFTNVYSDDNQQVKALLDKTKNVIERLEN